MFAELFLSLKCCEQRSVLEAFPLLVYINNLDGNVRGMIIKFTNDTNIDSVIDLQEGITLGFG